MFTATSTGVTSTGLAYPDSRCRCVKEVRGCACKQPDQDGDEVTTHLSPWQWVTYSCPLRTAEDVQMERTCAETRKVGLQYNARMTDKETVFCCSVACCNEASQKLSVKRDNILEAFLRVVCSCVTNRELGDLIGRRDNDLAKVEAEEARHAKCSSKRADWAGSVVVGE